jgi:hypothetical protein
MTHFIFPVVDLFIEDEKLNQLFAPRQQPIHNSIIDSLRSKRFITDISFMKLKHYMRSVFTPILIYSQTPKSCYIHHTF